MRAASEAETCSAFAKRRFRPAALEVKMWRAKECRRITLPEAVSLKRLVAPLCVFNFCLGKFNLPKIP